MAPRGRPRRRGHTRMDAALDAMRTYGFPQGLIVKTIKELLNVYGEDGWPFIEEFSYKVLVDAILEKVEEKEQQKKDNSTKDDEIGGNDTKSSDAGPSTGALVPTFSHVEDMDIESPTNEALGSASQRNEALGTALLTNESDGKSHLPPAEGEGSSRKDIKLDQDLGRKQKNKVNEIVDDENSHGVAHVEKNSSSPVYAIRSPQPVDSHPPRRRRPCHGWICSDDEEDIVQLTPAPLSEALAKYLFGTDRRKKRKSRWDVRPEDM